MKKIVIIGAQGFIGSHFLKYFSDKYAVVGFNKKDLDVTSIEDWKDKFDEKMNGVFVLFLAGSKDVQKLEKDWEYAYKTNTLPILNYIQVLRKSSLKCKFIYFSSDYVFDGQRGNYTSDDYPNPITNYGKSKLLAENALQESGLDYKIIRTSAVIGEGSKFYDWLINSLKTENSIDMLVDSFFTPTNVAFLTKNVEKIINNYELIKKIVHIVGDKSFSRYEFACYIKEKTPDAIAIIKKSRINISQHTFCKNLTMVQDDIEEILSHNGINCCC